MEENGPIRRAEVIGKFIAAVFEIDLPYNAADKWQERLVVVQLESGLRFSLQQKSWIIDPASNLGLVYPLVDPAMANLVAKPGNSRGQVIRENRSDSPAMYRMATPHEELGLVSSIRCLAIPYNWKFGCAVILENDFALYIGFGDWDNGLLFHKLGPDTKPDFSEFNLPN